MNDDKRRFSRVPFQVKTEITIDDSLHSAEGIDNLSVGGCLVPLKTKTDLEVGAECHVKILLSGTSSELSIEIDGTILRSSPEGVAIKFTSVDVDSLFHLQNVIRYNSPDADIIDAELREHVALH